MQGGEGKLKVALEVVKMAGIQTNAIGPTDPDDIVADEEKRRDWQMMEFFTLKGTLSLDKVYEDLVEKAGS